MNIKGKKLYRSDTDKVFAGVLGGLGEFLDVDSMLLRLGFLILVLLSGLWPGVAVYIVAMFLIPKRGVIHVETKESASDSEKKE